MQTFTRKRDTFMGGEGLSEWEPDSSPEVLNKVLNKEV